MSAADHHFRREDRANFWQRISDHIAAHPEDLDIALENIARWEALGRVHPGPLQEWRKRISEARGSSKGLQAFVAFLAEPNHDSEPIKSCSPFVGLALATTPSEAS